MARSCISWTAGWRFLSKQRKTSNYRYSPISGPDVFNFIAELEDIPDVDLHGRLVAARPSRICAGFDQQRRLPRHYKRHVIVGERRFLKKSVRYFSSSHERSHILCAFGMSQLPKGTPCYALVWEGAIGAFYEIDPDLNITLVADVLNQPGNRYALLYGLADPTFPKDGPYPRFSDAGKLMALASFSTSSIPYQLKRRSCSAFCSTAHTATERLRRTS